MSGEVESLTLEMLRRLDRRLDTIEGDMQDIKLRISAVEDHLGTGVASLAGVNHRLDRFDERLGRIERRFDVVGPR